MTAAGRAVFAALATFIFLPAVLATASAGATTTDDRHCAKVRGRADVSSEGSRAEYRRCSGVPLVSPPPLLQPSQARVHELETALQQARFEAALRLAENERLRAESDAAAARDLAVRSQAEAEVARVEANHQSVRASFEAKHAADAEKSAQICRYKVNALSAVLGLTSLARAVKIKDDLSVLGLVLPIPFTICEKPAGKGTFFVKTDDITIGDPAKSQTVTVFPSDSAAVISVRAVDSTVCTVSQPNTAKFEFTVAGVAKGKSTLIVVSDGSGSQQTIKCTVSR